MSIEEKKSLQIHFDIFPQYFHKYLFHKFLPIHYTSCFSNLWRMQNQVRNFLVYLYDNQRGNTLVFLFNPFSHVALLPFYARGSERDQKPGQNHTKLMKRFHKGGMRAYIKNFTLDFQVIKSIVQNSMHETDYIIGNTTKSENINIYEAI